MQAKQSSATVSPYLYFGGRCQEALDFYAQAVGARVEFVLRYDQSPQPVPAGMLAPGFESKVMHASLRIGGTLLQASDGRAPGQGHAGYALSLNVDGVPAAGRAFAALSKEGTVTMPLAATFFSPCFGMLVDRFGVAWIVRAQASGQG